MNYHVTTSQAKPNRVHVDINVEHIYIEKNRSEEDTVKRRKKKWFDECIFQTEINNTDSNIMKWL